MKYLRRSKARELALQALYWWQISQEKLAKIANKLVVNLQRKNIDLNYFNKLICGVSSSYLKSNSIIQCYLPYTLQSVSQIEKSILQIALYELDKKNNLPYKVVINESIELAKLFGGERSYKLINGVLDNFVSKNQHNVCND